MKLNKLNEKTKLRLVIGFFILALAAIIFLIAKNGWLMGSADTLNVQAAAGPVYVPLTKELADAVKAGSADQARLDELTSQKLQETFSQIPQSSAATPSRQPESADQSQKAAPENFLDAVVVYTDENGKPILPDLEKLQQESAQTRAEGKGVPESNKIDFVIGNGWTDAEKTEIQKTIDEDVPKIRAILGPPLFSIQVRIDKKDTDLELSGYGAYYDSSRNLIVVINPKDASSHVRFTLRHEISHAWRDELGAFRNVEESLATFTANYLSDYPGPRPTGEIKAIYSNLVAYYNDSDITQYYHALNPGLVYNGRPFAKVYLEDNEFLKKFHNNLYNASQGFYGFITIAAFNEFKEILLKSLPPTIEGIPASDWLKSQYLWLPASDTPGGHFVIEPYGQYASYYRIRKDIESSPLYFESFPAGQEFEIVAYDSKNQLLKKITVEDSIETPAGPSGKALSVRIDLQKVYSLDMWQKIVIKNKQNNDSKSFVIFGVHHFLAYDRKVVFTEPTILKKNINLTIENKIGDQRSASFPVADTAPNAPNGLTRFTESWSNFFRKPYHLYGPTVFRLSCPLYNEDRSPVDIGQLTFGFDDPVFYLSPPAELKSYKEPEITIESPDELEWIIKANKPVAITATIVNFQNQTIKTLEQSQLIDSSAELSWNGKNDKNGSVPEGEYTLKVNVVDKLCGIASSQTKFSLAAGAANSDSQRKKALKKLKAAIDTYYSQKGEFPGTDGWISSIDFPNQNDSLAETLLPAAVIDKIPVDPTATGPGGNGGYIYYRDDYCDGDKYTYSLYAQLDNPSAQDKETMKSGAKCNSHSDITGNPNVNYRLGGSMVNDKQRKADLAKLKVAIDKYYEQKKEFPGTDGWISSIDFPNQNDSLAETLLPAAVIDKIPVDPTATGPGGNGGYIYYRDDYCDGDKYTYSLYAQLDNPSAQDKETMKSGAKCNSHSDITGNPNVNYRLGATIPKPDYETTTISGKGAKIYPVSKLPEKYQEILKVKLIKGWNMVSIPFGIEKKEANKGDFDGLPQFNAFLPAQNKYQQETVNQPGSGYLVMSPAPKEYAITNVDKVKILDDDPLVGQFEIPLKKGWNLIGNPYLRETDTANWKVKYTDRLLLLFKRTKTVNFASAATYINPKLMIMSNQQYADATKLAPYQGAWIYSYKDGVTLLIP